MSSEKVSIKDLLAVCLFAVKHSGQIIRDVANSRETQDTSDLCVVNKNDNMNLHTGNEDSLKNIDPELFDPQTVADIRAQSFVWRVIRQFYPHIHIIGEEGDNDALELCPRDEAVVSAMLARHSNSQIEDMRSLLDQDMKDVYITPDELVITLDPLDGTREFVSKNYKDVTTLVGIARRGSSVGGVIGEPFRSDQRLTYGFKNIGVFSSQGFRLSPFTSKSDRAEYARKDLSETPYGIVTSASRCTGATKKAIETLQANGVIDKVVTAGGAGSKYIKILYGEVDCWTFPRPGCSRWDICGGDALVEELGGRSTDCHGVSYTYVKLDDESTYENTTGVVTASSEKLHKLIVDVTSTMVLEI